MKIIIKNYVDNDDVDTDDPENDDGEDYAVMITFVGCCWCCC